MACEVITVLSITNMQNPKWLHVHTLTLCKLCDFNLSLSLITQSEVLHEFFNIVFLVFSPT